MLFCRKCGAKLPEDSAFCGKCGTAVVTEAQDGGGESSLNASEPSPITEDAPAKVTLSKGESHYEVPKPNAAEPSTRAEKKEALSAVTAPAPTGNVGSSPMVARGATRPNLIKRFLSDRSVYTFAAKYFAVVAGVLVLLVIGVFAYCSTQDYSIDTEISSYHLVIDTHLLSGYGLPYDAVETSSVASARNKALSLATEEYGDSSSDAEPSDEKETKK